MDGGATCCLPVIGHAITTFGMDAHEVSFRETSTTSTPSEGNASGEVSAEIREARPKRAGPPASSCSAYASYGYSAVGPATNTATTAHIVLSTVSSPTAFPSVRSPTGPIGFCLSRQTTSR